MKKLLVFKVKNYKGNLVESLKRFSDSHKGMKIVEACEDGDDLKIKAEASSTNEISFSIDWDGSNETATKYFHSEIEAKKYWKSVSKKYGINISVKWSNDDSEVFFNGEKKKLEKFIFEYLANNDDKKYAEAIDWINEMNDTNFSKTYN